MSETQLIICSKCESANPAKAKFCLFCHTNLQLGVSTNFGNFNVPPYPSPMHISSSFKKIGIASGAVIIFAFIILLIVRVSLPQTTGLPPHIAEIIELEQKNNLRYKVPSDGWFNSQLWSWFQKNPTALQILAKSNQVSGGDKALKTLATTQTVKFTGALSFYKPSNIGCLRWSQIVLHECSLTLIPFSFPLSNFLANFSSRSAAHFFS